MTGVLFQKEWQRNWFTFLWLGIVVWTVILIACYFYNANGTGAGVFSGVGLGLMYLMPIACLFLGHALVATEYQSKTQLFLEGLPLPKWRMITMKLVLAFAVTVFYAVGSVLIGWLYARGSEVVTPRFLGILLASACSWSLFAMGFFFVTGFLGRYRLLIYLALVIAIMILMSSSVPMARFPPYALIDHNRFGLEREVWPISNLRFTGIFIIVWVVAAYILGLAKEGSISTMLGEKMSYREKMFIGGALVIGGLAISSVFSQPKPEPFSLPGAVVEEWNGVQVAISPEDPDPDKPVDTEVAIAGKLARRLAEQRDWLGIPLGDFPKIFIVEKTDIEEKEKIDWDESLTDNSILMYAGYREPEFSENRLLSWTLSQIMRKNSMKRVGREHRWWIICGLEGLWEMDLADPETIQAREKLAVEAVKKHGLTIDNLWDWSKYQEDVEWRSADAVAWMGMRLLAETKGKEIVQAFAKRSVTRRFTRVDGRAVLWDYTNPVAPAFQAATGISLEEHVKQWREYILSFESKKEVKP